MRVLLNFGNCFQFVLVVFWWNVGFVFFPHSLSLSSFHENNDEMNATFPLKPVIMKWQPFFRVNEIRLLIIVCLCVYKRDFSIVYSFLVALIICLSIHITHKRTHSVELCFFSIEAQYCLCANMKNGTQNFSLRFFLQITCRIWVFGWCFPFILLNVFDGANFFCCVEIGHSSLGLLVLLLLLLV